MITLIVFLAILGLLVFVHELGHFVVARRNGIKCNEFGFGFPPRAIGIQFLYDENGKAPKDKKNRWRIIWGKNDGDDESEKEDLKEARAGELHGGTVYSLNWIPIGGFVKIKGENGEGKKESNSFASKSAWTRTKVLAAGVTMNFIFAWLFFSFGFMAGTPQEVIDENSPNSKILISSVEENSPASAMGIIPGDVVLKSQSNDGKNVALKTVKDLQDYIANFKGKPIVLQVERGNVKQTLQGTPRENNDDGKGLLGIGLTQVETVRYSFFTSLWKGLQETGGVVIMTYDFLFRMFGGDKTVINGVSGIVGVATITGQVIPLGFAAIARLIAIFSINLAIINILPFPALDGGRILFILIEKIKGSPVSQKVEQGFHTAGFALLMLLMLVVTYRDLMRLDVVGKIGSLF